MQVESKLLAQITDTIARNASVESAVIFGSRAMDTSTDSSDIDIALRGSITPLEAEAIARDLEDYIPTLLQFDVVAYDRISLPALREHIDRVGVEFYRSGNSVHSAKPNTARA